MSEIPAEHVRALAALVGELVPTNRYAAPLPDADPAAWRAVGQRIAHVIDQITAEEADRAAD